MRRIFVLFLAAACARELSVPAPVPPPAVGVSTFSPAQGWAGQRITVTGHDLGSPTETEVRFGQSARVAPVSVSADGKSLDVFVPDDATTGPVSVSTPLGQATTSASFTFSGVGRLRQNALAASVDLRVQVGPIAAVGNGRVATVVPGSRWAGLFAHGWQTLSGAVNPVAIAYAATADQVVLADLDTTGCTGALGRVVLPDSSVAPLCLTGTIPDGFGPYSLSVTTDDQAQHVIASAGPLLFFFDLTGATPAMTTAQVGDLTATAAPLAWVDTDHFLAFDDDGIRPITLSAGTPVGDAVSTSGAVVATAVSVNATAKLAAICQDGDVKLVDLSAWPPALATGSSALLDQSCGAVGLSPDGKRALATTANNTAVLLDVSNPAGTWLSLAATPVESPVGVAVQPDGFFVSGRGGITILSVATGAPLMTLPLSSNLVPPVVRTTAGGQTVVDIPRSMTNTLVRLSADTLQPAFFEGTADTEINFSGEAVSAVTSDGHTLWAVHNQTLRRLPPGAAHEDDTTWTPADAASYGAFDIQASRDGSAVFLRYNSGGFIHQKWVIATLDAKAAWGTSYTPPVYAVDQSDTDLSGAFPARVVEGDAGHAWLVDRKTVRPFLVSDAVQGKALGAPIALATLPLTAVSALGALFVPESLPIAGVPSSIPEIVLRVAADASTLESDKVPVYNASESEGGAVLSPSGRRLYALAGTGSERRLTTTVFDPETGAAGEELPPIPMPPHAGALIPLPGGEKLLVLDTYEDRLLLVE